MKKNTTASTDRTAGVWPLGDASSAAPLVPVVLKGGHSAALTAAAVFHTHMPHASALARLEDQSILPIGQTELGTLYRTAYERLFGYPRSELLGETIEKLIPERLRGHHVGHRERYFHKPNVREMGAGLDLWGRRKDGSEFPIEISLSPLSTARGMYATASIRDISARRKSQQQFRALLESAPDAMVILNERSEIMLINAQTERMFGYRREALIGRSVEVLIPERLRGHHENDRERHFLTPNVSGSGAGLELWGRRKDGGEFPIEVSLSPMETESGTWGTAAIRDVSERLKAEARFRDLFAYSPDAILISNQEGVIVDANQLRPSLPPNLLLWAGAWTPWEADNLTLRRDLLDRIDGPLGKSCGAHQKGHRIVIDGGHRRFDVARADGNGAHPATAQFHT